MGQKKEKDLYGNHETIQSRKIMHDQGNVQNRGTAPKKEGGQILQEKIQTFPETPSPSSYLSAKGDIRFKMTNDYLFRAVFQSNEKALKGLLCSVLHRKPEEIQTVEITNPIELGKSLDDKTFVLDITLRLNNHSIINIEMQVSNWLNWPERSLSYLCRTFDHLMRGEDYIEARPVTQICFLNFTLFPQFPEFYATYQILNIKNHNLYSDKFTLSVVDLTQVGAATEEDKADGIDQWAALFKATKWEDVKMLSQKNKYLEEASQSMYQLSADERIRQQCAAREENERLERGMQKMKKKLDEKAVELDEKAVALDEKAVELDEKAVALSEKAVEIEGREAKIKKREAEMQAQQKELQGQQEELERQKAQLKEWKAQLREQEAQLKNKESN